MIRKAIRGARLATVDSALFILLLTLGLAGQPAAAVKETPPVASLYAGQPWRVTDGRLHGLAGWRGVDVSGGCGAALYNPLPTVATVTYSGADGYVGPHSGGEQNTMLMLTAGSVEATLLHGLYLPQIGDAIQPGQLIGYEASVGNSTGCHTHLILRHNGETLNALQCPKTSCKALQPP
jgi:murein DD-endopeptidase MepM/ murein hydrolase activator NlpD